MREIFLALNVEELANGEFLVTCEDLPGLFARGKTESEALDLAADIAEKMIESYLEKGEDLPPGLMHNMPMDINSRSILPN